MGKHIFKIENIEVGEPQVFDIPEGSKVTVNHFQLKKDKVSRIEVEKNALFRDTIFITLYNGNKEIGTVVSEESYVLDWEVAHGIKYYDIRPADKFDRKDEGNS